MLLLAGLAAGCGGARSPSSPPVPDAAAEACLLAPAGARDSESIRAAASAEYVNLLDAARARTPLGFDCTGRPVSRLASAWSRDSSRSAWTLVVPTSSELATRWRADARAAQALRFAGVTSFVPIDEHRLVVSFAAPQDAVPLVFADPSLALPAQNSTASVDMLPPRTDLRDAIDSGADLVVTSDPAVLDYAASRAGVSVRPLPWNRTYVLVTVPGQSLPLDPGSGDSSDFRAALARDAVRVAARPAEPPYWWETARVCPLRPHPRVTTTPGVAYPENDMTARALAERIVAMGGERGMRVHPVPATASGSAARGTWAAYVVPLPKTALVPCRELAGLPPGAVILPLIDTRPAAILRDGAPPVVVDHDGGLVPDTAP
jgi:hypothetical protein